MLKTRAPPAQRGEGKLYNLNWSRAELTPQRLGTFGEYYAKMSLASYGMRIYTAEVDDHGIDFVAETPRGFLKFQVKAVRGSSGYIFMRREHFDVTDRSLYLFLLVLEDGEHPAEYVIPATAWDGARRGPLVYHGYEGKKSAPEFGVNLSRKNLEALERYRLEHMIADLSAEAAPAGGDKKERGESSWNC